MLLYGLLKSKFYKYAMNKFTNYRSLEIDQYTLYVHKDICDILNDEISGIVDSISIMGQLTGEFDIRFNREYNPSTNDWRKIEIAGYKIDKTVPDYPMLSREVFFQLGFIIDNFGRLDSIRLWSKLPIMDAKYNRNQKIDLLQPINYLKKHVLQFK